jgi:hypothetical protein
MLDGFPDASGRQGIEGHRGVSHRNPPEVRKAVERL